MAMRDLLRLLWSRFVTAGPLQWLLMVLLVLCIALLVLAGPVPQPQRPPLTTGHSRAWFDCFDCRRGELDSVVALVRRQPSVTVGLLGEVVRHGPNAADTAAFADGLRRTHARTTAWLAANEPAILFPTELAYVAERMRLFDRAWRVRAAIALGRVIEVDSVAAASPGGAASLNSVCADTSQHDVWILRQAIWARLAADTMASAVCRDRAHALGIPLRPGP